jgi:two-component sensor histidine kinase
MAPGGTLMNDRHWLFRYSLGVGLFLVALGLRFLAEPLLPPGFPFLTFFPAIIVATFVAGAGPGSLCAVLSGVAALYFFIPPANSLLLDYQSGVAIAFFTFIVVVDILIIDRLTGALADLRAEREKAVLHAEQRDTLFKELQHRIGNNLQSVSALLNIQLRAVKDPEARRALSDGVQRVGVIADIHRMFHDPAHSDGRIDDDFVRELAERCIDTAGARDRVRLATDITPIALPQDKFLPVALILTECINNAIEHGLGQRPSGTISVTLERSGGLAELRVRDDGPGVPPGFDLAAARSIGLTVLRSFASQLGGTLTITNDGGTLCRLTFDIPTVAHHQVAWSTTGLKAAYPT